MLKVGVSINSCDVKCDERENLANQIDRSALLKTKFPKVLPGLGKLKGYQLKLPLMRMFDQSLSQYAEFLLVEELK